MVWSSWGLTGWAPPKGLTKMTTDKRNEILTTYVGDVHALVAHGLEAIDRQVENLKDVSHQDAKTVVNAAKSMLEAQKSVLAARVEALGGSTTKPFKDAVSAIAGVAAGLINAVRPSETVKSLRDDHTYFSHLGISFLLLHTTAAGLSDAETEKLAEQGYRETARLVMMLDNTLPKITVEELREDGTTVLDVADKTREMLKNAWNREKSTT